MLISQTLHNEPFKPTFPSSLHLGNSLHASALHFITVVQLVPSLSHKVDLLRLCLLYQTPTLLH